MRYALLKPSARKEADAFAAGIAAPRLAHRPHARAPPRIAKCASIFQQRENSEDTQNDKAGPAWNLVVHLGFDNGLEMPGAAVIRRSALEAG